jgi:hypothetical protein
VTEDFPELQPLVKALTADAAPAELDSEEAAVAMFSAFSSQRGARSPRRRRFVPPVSVAAAAAVVLAALTGGAYAAVLPASMQHIAHRVLFRIGVPDVRQPGSSAGSSPLSVGSLSDHSSAATAEPPAAGSPATLRPGPVPAGPPLPGRPLLLSAARTQIAAGSTATLVGRLAPGATPRTAVLVRLLELTGSRWRPVGSALTGANGTVTFTVRHLTRNTRFELAGPDGADAASAALLVTVVPRLTLTLSSDRLPGMDVITVSVRYADPGDIVMLQIAQDGGWSDVAEQPLGGQHQASFTVAVAAGQFYRVALPATGTHAGVVSPVLYQLPGNPASATSPHGP